MRRDRQLAGSPGLVYEEADGHTTAVVGHWCLLIRGEGRLWRGDTPRIVWVRGEGRLRPQQRHVRFHVAL